MKRIESLKEKLANSKESERIKILNEISEAYARINSEECLRFAKEALKLSEKTKSDIGKAVSLKNIALCNYFKGDYEEAESNLIKAYSSIEKVPEKNAYIADFKLLYSSIYQSMEKYDKAYEECISSYRYYEDKKDLSGMSKALNQLGNLSTATGEDKKALKYYKKSLLMAKKSKNVEMEGNALNNIAIIYRHLGNYKNAIKYFSEAAKIFKKNNINFTLAATINNLSLTYASIQDYDKAKKYNKQAKRMYKKFNNERYVILMDYNMADICIRTKEFEKSYRLFRKVVRYSEKVNDTKMLRYSYLSLYKLFNEQKNYKKALDYYKKFHESDIQILNENEIKNITRLETKFKLHQKEEQLKKIKNDNIKLKNIHEIDRINIKKLRVNQDFYKLILENSHNGIAILNDNLDIIYANNLFFKIFGVKKENINNFDNILSKESLKEILKEKKLLGKNLKTKSKHQFDIVTKEGKKRNIEVTISQFKNQENEWFYLANFNDLTKEIERQEKLRLLIRAFKQSPTAIVITDTNGKIKYVNPKFTELTAYNPEEVINKNPRILKSGQSKVSYKTLWKTISKGKEWNGIFYNKRKDGSCYWEHADISPVLDNSGNITHYIKIAEDITEKKKAEEKIQTLLIELKKANAAKDKFFSIIAHDLRSPFASLSAFVNIMKKYYDKFTKEKIMKLIDELDKSTKNTFSLLENLLTWSRMQSGGMKYNPQFFELTPLSMDVINLYKQKAEQKKIKLVFHKPENNMEVFADKFMIDTALRNLVNNALKFTPEEGKVEIIIKDKKKFLEIQIKDTGVGIPKDRINNLFHIDTNFSTFGTNREKGTGLGLILCKEFIEKNNGKIWVKSAEGKGTIFYFTVPKAKPKEEEQLQKK